MGDHHACRKQKSAEYEDGLRNKLSEAEDLLCGAGLNHRIFEVERVGNRLHDLQLHILELDWRLVHKHHLAAGAARALYVSLAVK